jgi:CBS domain-containing protein
MSGLIDLSRTPFAALTEKELGVVRDRIGTATFAAGEVLKSAGERWAALFLILRGTVEAVSADGTVRHFGPNDLVEGRDLVRGERERTFTAARETVCLVLDRATIDQLLERNSKFRHALAQKRPPLSRMRAGIPSGDAFTMARVRDALVRKPLVLPAGTPATDGVAALQARSVDCLLVHKDDRYGMVTGTDLLEAVTSVDGLSQPLDNVATWDLVSASPDDFLFDVLVRLTRRNIERVPVFDKGKLTGLLEQTDILSLFSTQSASLGIRIERAESVEELEAAAAGMVDLTRMLVDRGVDISLVLDLLSALNERIMSRLFSLVVPREVHKQTCLIVMGSEGRGEQILKTDQDNALILADDLDWPGVHDVMQQFSADLGRLGYPPCPGNYMVSNPKWVMTVTEWHERVEGWLRSPDGDSMLDLTVFSDAHPVAGERRLFGELNDWFLERIHRGIGFIPSFAHPVLRFQVPLGLFGGIRNADEGIDIKKGGIFPLVHGVRSMALDAAIHETNTFRRIDALVKRGDMDRPGGDDLKAALEIFMLYRLRQQMEAIAAGEKPDNIIRPAGLRRMEREQLRRALRTVKAFQQRLARRYHLEI